MVERHLVNAGALTGYVSVGVLLACTSLLVLRSCCCCDAVQSAVLLMTLACVISCGNVVNVPCSVTLAKR